MLNCSYAARILLPLAVDLRKILLFVSPSTRSYRIFSSVTSYNAWPSDLYSVKFVLKFVVLCNFGYELEPTLLPLRRVYVMPEYTRSLSTLSIHDQTDEFQHIGLMVTQVIYLWSTWERHAIMKHSLIHFPHLITLL